jgi:UDP-N-acetylmuramoyl-L-alanyl-D-glutamate--2,6-diaminopimelate ligase
MEVSSIALDQGRTDGLDFAAGVFTNLSGDHMDYHRTPENYLKAKTRLFAGLTGSAAAVLNADDAASVKIARRTASRIVWYSLTGPADVFAADVVVDRSGSRFELHAGGKSTTIRTPLVGEHNVSNCLAAAGAAIALGLDWNAITEGLRTAPPVPGRLEPVPSDRGFSVLVDYAHTDDSLARVLAALRPLTAGRILCVFGCGGDRDRTKRPRMAAAAEKGADLIFVTSDNPRTENPAMILAEILGGFSPAGRARVVVDADRRGAIGAAIAAARAGDVVLIAGKGHEDYQIIGTTKIRFDDREVAAEFLNGSSARAAS